MKFNDAILGLVTLLAGLAIVLEASTFPATHGQAYGPDLFPTIIGTGLAFSGLMLIVSGWRARAATGWIEVSGINRSYMLDAAAVLVSILVFILLVGKLGFVLVSLLTTGLLMVRFRRGAWLSSVLISLVFSLVSDWVFRSMLLVPLPQGHVLPSMPW
ncbi:MAG: tripartite tricarboxylate transporter TctB family protein [Geminicoccaceae bacterium]|nr:tripartite tricarboxylate transporter TctB family protein [Geminicoccaceae bacterium]MCB9945794.1 tripartite tricarboxylate transporter TctB family protein [Geminicoccaceae bacterium]